MAVRKAPLVGLLIAALGLWACGSSTGGEGLDPEAWPGEDGAGDPDADGDHRAPHPAFSALSFPLNIGHGGAKHLCAENTLECFQLAVDAGAQAMEADVQVLGDGSIVMFHDDNAIEQTGVDKRLLDMTLGELRELDAGWGYTRDDGATHPLRGQGLRVPTFDAFLAAFPGMPILLDVKPESPQMAEALLKFSRGALGDADRKRLYIKSNDQALTDALRALPVPPRVAMSGAERGLLLFAPDQAPEIPPTWIDLNPPSLTPEVVAWAHRHGHLITASTVNDDAEMSALLEDFALDGLVTNRPDLLQGVLGR